MSSIDRQASFAARGGWWVVAQAPVLLGAIVLPLAAGDGALWPQQWLQWFGVALVFVGFALTAGGLVALGDALTPFPRPRPDAALRTDGVYALVRHPVYSGLVFASLGWALWWSSGWGAAYTVVVFAFVDRKAAREEKWLSAKFPDYADYRYRTRKLIPLIY